MAREYFTLLSINWAHFQMSYLVLPPDLSTRRIRETHLLPGVGITGESWHSQSHFALYVRVAGEKSGKGDQILELPIKSICFCCWFKMWSIPYLSQHLILWSTVAAGFLLRLSVTQWLPVPWSYIHIRNLKIIVLRKLSSIFPYTSSKDCSIKYITKLWAISVIVK